MTTMHSFFSKKNRLRMLTVARNVRWLACQGHPFRGHDECETSSNAGNCLELLKHAAAMNPEIAEAISSAPHNAMYTSYNNSMQMLEVIAKMVRTKIRREIGDAKFCILVDEAQDEINCEQIAIVVRFVDKEGFVQERFIDIVGVEDTCAETLKQGCSRVLDHNTLLVQNMRGQGYNGGGNMRGVVNGLHTLFLKECPYAYYVHCFAHHLQLALVAASSEAADHDGKTVFVDGLDGDYLRRSFGFVLDILPIADSVTKLMTRCELCVKRASLS